MYDIICHHNKLSNEFQISLQCIKRLSIQVSLDVDVLAVVDSGFIIFLRSASSVFTACRSP